MPNSTTQDPPAEPAVKTNLTLDAEIKEAMCDAAKAAVNDHVGDLAEIRTQLDGLLSMRQDLEKLADDQRELVRKRVIERAKDPVTGRYRGQFRDEDQAHRFGMFALAIAGNPFARDFCKRESIDLAQSGWMTDTRTMVGGTGASGGFLVPEEFSRQLIRNVEEYGVIEQVAMRVPMASDTFVWPMRTGGLTVYYPDEGVAPTASDVALGQVILRAHKWMTLTYTSSELSEDAILSIAELIGFEFALAIATAQDKNAFNGTGTAAYGRVDGMLNKVGSAGVQDGASGQTGFATVGYEIFGKAIGSLPRWAGRNPRWYMHNSVLWAQMTRTYATTGELLVKEVMVNGVRTPSFLGVPVEITQVLPALADTAVSTKFAVVGDLYRGVALGRRGGVDLATSDQYKFAEDVICFRGRVRQDIQVHQPGTSAAVGAYSVVKTAAS